MPHPASSSGRVFGAALAIALAIGGVAASPAQATDAQPEKEPFLFVVMLPSSVAIAAIAINSVELSDGNGSPPGWVAFGIVGSVLALGGSAFGYGIVDSFASDDQPFIVAAAITSTAIGIASLALSIIGADQYSSGAESDDLALYLAPSVSLEGDRAGLELGGAF